MRMTRRPHIAYFELSPTPSGLTRYVNGLLDAIDPGEFRVTIFCHPQGVYTARPNVDLAPVPFCSSVEAGATNSRVANPNSFRAVLRSLWREYTPPGAKSIGGYVRGGLRLVQLFRRHDVSLLHVNETGFCPSIPAARLAGVPRILWTYHADSTYDLYGERNRLSYRLLETVSNRLVSCGIGVSRSTSDDWVRRTGLPARRVVSIWNGVSTQDFRRRCPVSPARASLGLPDDGRVYFGGVGRVHEHKGFEFLIRSIALLKARYPQASAAIAGTGPLQQQLKQLADDLGVSDRIHFLGYQADVLRVLEALDVFVLSSRCEAMPYALLEAMGLGLPVVSTRVGGIAEAILEGETGFIVPVADVSALADRMARFLDDEALRERMGAQGRLRVEQHFTQAESANRTVSVYRRLLANPMRAR